MIEQATLRSRYDDLDISVIVVRPEGEAKAVLQLVHGMSGCKERFMPFMEFMAGKGVVCVANDLRGHGESVKTVKDLGYMYQGGKGALIDDMRGVTEAISREYPGIPVFLLGHSMGSLAARVYAREDDSMLDGVILCGSPGYSYLAPLGYAISTFLNAVGLGRWRPKLIHRLTSDLYNHDFDSEGPMAWICSDPQIRKDYIENPKTGFRFTVNANKVLMGLMMGAYGSQVNMACNKDMPVIFLSGDDDPCIKGSHGLEKALAAMHEAGYRNIMNKTYPAMRHEILNEIGKERVWQDVLEFMNI
ncbi:MAG: alpha/beta hydrolase [Bacteroidales bacterium]|nr:alpha/beta hydrolase [Bacteroidales bacterium]